MKKLNQKDFSLFFLTGKHNQFLSKQQQKQILNIIRKENLSTSIYLYDSAQTIRKCRQWKQKLPWIKVHYAVKANPSKQIIQDLLKQGCNFDCASKNQIQLVLSLGAKVQQIVYSNTIKQECHLEFANNLKIKLTTADTFQQLQKILQYAPNLRILWRISIKQQAKDKLSSQFSGKFGDDFKNRQQIKQRIKLNIGIHFHCGSGHHGSSGFGKGISLARQCIQIGRQCGHDMTILDIGGGFPGSGLNQKIINALKVTQNDPLKYQVYAEPGQNLCKTSFYLLTKVIGKKNQSNQINYFINESNYHSFYLNTLDVNNLWHANQFYSRINTKENQPQQIKQTQISTLYGMTSSLKDIIAKNIQAPVNLDISDWLCISGMGAYYQSAKTNFSGLQAANTILKWKTHKN